MASNLLLWVDLRSSRPLSSNVVIQECLTCGRAFETERVTVFRHEFVADRFCEFCREAERVAVEQKRADFIFGQAHIPRAYSENSFASFIEVEGTRHAIALCKQWCRDFRAGQRPRRGLLLHGPSGSGKTHLAVAIVREVIYSRFEARSLFLNVPQWLNALREAWNSSDGEEPANPRGYELLVIDDLGAEQTTPWSRERIYSLINHQEQFGRLTIVTSNLNPGDLARRLGGPSASRLTKLCADVPVQPRSDFRALVAATEVSQPTKE